MPMVCRVEKDALSGRKGVFMRKLLPLLNLLFLIACAPQIGAAETHVAFATTVIPTSTSLPPTRIPPLTATRENLCNPFEVDFCITDGRFIFQRPIHPPANDLIDPSYRYGSTANGTREPHHGVEFLNPSGTPVYAAADGTVMFAGLDDVAVYAPWGNFYGNLVVLQHESGLSTVYAHLSRVDVAVGQQVRAGDQLGEVGMTGVAIGSHLHFEVRQGQAEDYFATQNPELWLAPATDAGGQPLGVLMISVVDESRELIKHAEFTAQYYPASSGGRSKTYYGTTYAAELLTGEENAVLGELPAGQYRVAVETNGKVYDRRVEVESGKLTQVVLVVR